MGFHLKKPLCSVCWFLGLRLGLRWGRPRALGPLPLAPGERSNGSSGRSTELPTKHTPRPHPCGIPIPRPTTVGPPEREIESHSLYRAGKVVFNFPLACVGAHTHMRESRVLAREGRRDWNCWTPRGQPPDRMGVRGRAQKTWSGTPSQAPRESLGDHRIQAKSPRDSVQCGPEEGTIGAIGRAASHLTHASSSLSPRPSVKSPLFFLAPLSCVTCVKKERVIISP